MMGLPEHRSTPLGEVCPELRECVLLGLITGDHVSVREASDELSAEMEALATRYEAEYSGCRPSDIPGLQPARELYRSLGIDPTRIRPSSEALLRRAIRGKPLPRILNAVDVCNLCSLEFLLPIGLYDSDRILGGATLRIGSAGESYKGIRKDVVHLEGRPVLVDEMGPFGNPTSDSLRTAVTTGTRSIFMIVFAPDSYGRERMERNLEFARRCFATYLASPSQHVLVNTVLYPPPEGSSL